MKPLHLFLGACFLFSVACNGNDTNKSLKKEKLAPNEAGQRTETVKSMRLKSPIKGSLFTLGKEIEIVMNPKRRAAPIDSVQLWGDGDWLETLYDEPWVWKWAPQKKNMGKHNLKLLAFHSDGSIGEVSTYVNLKSNLAPQEYSYEVVNSFPHDKRAYTQGLFFHGGFLYEGTGQKGESSLRKVKLENGEALSVMSLEQEYFGEGITYHDGRIIQLTWVSGKAFVIDPETFQQKDIFYPQTSNGQGWGITTMGNELVVSDGTNVLSVFDPYDFRRKRTIEVYDHKGKVANLNELEYINGKIYANVWLTDRIVIIDPKTGRVEGNVDLGSILKPSERNKMNRDDDVLNGIAWDASQNRLFVTGKRWPRLFEIKIIKK